MRLDLPRNPGNYITASARFDNAGRVFALLQNRAPVALRDVQITPVLIDRNGRIVQQGSAVSVREKLAPGAQVTVATGITGLTADQAPALRFRIDGARLAD